MVIFLAGLQTISTELYEAARIDSANRRQQFWHITLPLLQPVMLVNVTLSLMGGFGVFDIPYVMTEGGPRPTRRLSWRCTSTFVASNSISLAMLSMPRELLDAAKVDGCTELAAFLRVVLPISGPALATVAILQFVGAWNEYFLALILVRSAEMRTIPLAIQLFFYAWGRTEWEQVFAALSIGSLPMILLYIVMQRQFIQGLTAGSVKG